MAKLAVPGARREAGVSSGSTRTVAVCRPRPILPSRIRYSASPRLTTGKCTGARASRVTASTTASVPVVSHAHASQSTVTRATASPVPSALNEVSEYASPPSVPAPTQPKYTPPHPGSSAIRTRRPGIRRTRDRRVLEAKPQRQLHDARIAGQRRDDADVRRRDVAFRQAEVGAVKHVEDIRTRRDVGAAAQSEPPLHAHVERDPARSAQDVAAGIAEGACRHGRECCRVEPLLNGFGAFRIPRQIRHAGLIRPDVVTAL